MWILIFCWDGVCSQRQRGDNKTSSIQHISQQRGDEAPNDPADVLILRISLGFILGSDPLWNGYSAKGGSDACDLLAVRQLWGKVHEVRKHKCQYYTNNKRIFKQAYIYDEASGDAS